MKEKIIIFLNKLTNMFKKRAHSINNENSATQILEGINDVGNETNNSGNTTINFSNCTFNLSTNQAEERIKMIEELHSGIGKIS